MKEIIAFLEKNHNLIYEIQEEKIIISNKKNDKNIKIIKETTSNKNNHFVDYIVSFATQHRHFDNDLEELKDYLSNILSDQILPIEFYLNNKNTFGGDIPLELYNNLSLKSLSDYFGYSEEYLTNYEVEVHSWSGKYDINRISVANLLKK